MRVIGFAYEPVKDRSACNIEELKTGTKSEFFNKFESHQKEIKKILGKKYGQQN